jgi:hypothetical protein
MSDITSIFTTFGIGFAAGYRAAIPALLLGVVHHTQYFELAERWQWLASPAVISILAVIAIVEIAADRMPESAELVELASWLPKAVVGFIGAAAAMGTVDSNVWALGASGLLGAGVAAATDRLRIGARRQTRELADSGAGGADKAAHHLESLAAVGVTGAAIFQPWLVLVVIAAVVAVGVAAYVISRGLSRTASRFAGFRSGDEPEGGP